MFLTAIAVTFVAVRGCIDWLDPFAGQSFDRAVWHKFHNNHEPDNPRASMSKDLRRRYLRQGLTKQEVVKLLGEPDMNKSDNMYEYNLGMWSGFRIDYDGLQIHFDAEGRLSYVQCVQH